MNNKIIVFVVILFIAASGLLFFWNKPVPANFLERKNDDDAPKAPSSNSPTQDFSVVATNLEIPWDVAFLPGGNFLVTERGGKISRLQSDGTMQTIFKAEVNKEGESGLLGLALHPNFETNNFVYFYSTLPTQNGQTENRVERFKFQNSQLTDKKVIISGIPGAAYHDGGRIAFGPDNLLYITTGDSNQKELPQNKNSLAGKILRVTDEGEIPSSNPFGTAIYSYGHRNPQGLAWDSEGQLWATEHGRSGALSGLDELNLIVSGGNYGWPDSQGDDVAPQTIGPVLHAGSDTWAPGSALYWDGSIFWGGLRGEAIYEAQIQNDKVSELKEHYKSEFGRIRTIKLGPDGMFYITTSNRDGRGNLNEGDDKIIRLDPQQFR